MQVPCEELHIKIAEGVPTPAVTVPKIQNIHRQIVIQIILIAIDIKAYKEKTCLILQFASAKFKSYS